MRTATILGLMVLGGLALTIAGCGKDTPEIQYRHYQGRVIDINLSAGEVTVEVFFKQDGKRRPFTGKMSPECEILIDGKTAEPKDVKIDDYVKLELRVEKRDGERHRVATKVEVIDRDPTGTASAPE